MLTKFWRKIWDNAPRQLQFSREGKILTGIALATGFAAINTGNNLLYLGWGLTLSMIVLSGILSETSLRDIVAHIHVPNHARAHSKSSFVCDIQNQSRLIPAFGLLPKIAIEDLSGIAWQQGPLALRINPRRQNSTAISFTPKNRGLHRVTDLRVATAFPFGFFVKTRRFIPASSAYVWVYPGVVDVTTLMQQFHHALGESLMARRGASDEFFAMREWRQGEDPRAIHWRRSASSRKPLVVEHAEKSGLRVLLHLHFLPTATVQKDSENAREYIIALAGSFTETLLNQGYEVGLSTHGHVILPQSGKAQITKILYALAQLDANEPILLPPRPLVTCYVAFQSPWTKQLPTPHQSNPITLPISLPKSLR